MTTRELELAERIAEAVRREAEPDQCQQDIVRLASRAGWRTARRLVLHAVHQRASAWGAAYS